MSIINKKNYFRMTLLFFIVAVIVAAISLQFVVAVIGYGFQSFRISMVESDAEKGYYTSRGHVTWTDEHHEAYKEANAEKMEYVESHDIANFLYHCGYSNTGKFFRLVSILTSVILLVCSLAFARAFGRNLIKYVERRVYGRSIPRGYIR